MGEAGRKYLERMAQVDALEASIRANRARDRAVFALIGMVAGFLMGLALHFASAVGGGM